MEYGFYTVASAIPSVRVADCDYNLSAIESIVDEAVAKGVGNHGVFDFQIRIAIADAEALTVVNHRVA